MNTKIAIPTRNGRVDDHFGHCEEFTVFSLDETHQIISREVIPSLQGCGCRSNIIHDLKRSGVNRMLAGNMGQGAFEKLQANGIEVIRGCSGKVDVVIGMYVDGKLQDQDILCDHHDHHHHHGHS